MPTKPRKRKPPTQRHSAKFPPYTVFISHSSKDLFIAEQIVTLIEGSGANCKIDKRDFEGGGNIWDEINDTVDKSQEVVILLTTNSKNSDSVKFDIGAASQKAAS